MFYGLDVHRQFIQVCQLDAKGANPKEYRIGGSAEEIDRWAQGLGPRDQVVLETTFHTWAIHAIVSQYAGRVVVANSLQVKAIAHAKIKTDKVDAYTLARLLHADFLPSVELPDEKTWAMRQLVSHRRLLVKQRTAIKNSVLATFHRCLIDPPEGKAFSARGQRWMRSAKLAPTERFLVDNGLDLLEAIEAQIDAADQQLLKTAAIEAQAQLLMTIPGVGVTVAMGLLAAIGDIRRFPSPGQLASYFGLVPRVSQSAGRCHHGRITKAGPANARSLAVEAAHMLARSPSPIATTFYRVRRKKGYNVAVTALARKLIVLVWYMLQNGEPYRYASVEQTRRKLRSLVPKHERLRALSPPRTVEEVYREAGLPLPSQPSQAERRVAANNRRTRTRLTRTQAKA
jgi:transposase